MAITTAITTSFKVELMGGTHVLGTDQIKVALFTSAATLDATTTNYTTTDEISGAGYTAGGVDVVTTAPTFGGTTAFIDLTDAVWTTATFTARGCIIYNSDKADRALATIDFGQDFAVSIGTFTVVMPVADSTNAIIRIG